MKRIAIVGGTGLLGRSVLHALHKHQDLFSITVISRKAPIQPTLPGVSYTTIETYTATDNSPLILALQGHDVLVSMLSGPIAPTVDPTLLAAAIKAQIPHFLPSEYTLDITHRTARSLGSGNLIGMRAAHADQLAEIAATGAIAYTTLVVGGFLDLGLQSGLLGFDLRRRKAVLYDHGTEGTCGSSVGFVAEAVVAALRMPEGEIRNRRVHAVEVEYSGREILRALEEVTGEMWSVEEKGGEELVRRGTKALGDGRAREAYLDFIVKLNYDGEGAAMLGDGLQFGEGFGLKRRSLFEIVKEVVGKAGKVDVEGKE